MELSAGISTTDRRSKIIAQLDATGRVGVQELSDLFKVSSVTIRNDLTFLENKNLLYRTRGGAIKQTKVAIDLALSEKAKKNSEMKKRIGVKAASFIQDGDTIILDSGTTTMEIAKQLKQFKNLVVITHALNIASELAGSDGIDIIMPGGMLREKSFSLVGPMAEKNLKEYYCDRLFLAVDGFDTKYGISTPCVSEAQLNRVMAEIAREVIVVADSSKFGKRSFAHILPVSKIDKVITDDGLDELERKKLENQNIEFIVV
ncbi:DeoR/GlpR transcriptional regulator [candidate division KSB1 bacterium]|nr:DeoR/GlpR transcriptional regulator [candidate division KSB1 bacterium]